MAHSGVAMSYFHQIWSRPGETADTRRSAKMQKAQTPTAKTARERAYIAALSNFYRPGKQEFPARIQAYSAMGKRTPSIQTTSMREPFMPFRCWRRAPNEPA